MSLTCPILHFCAFCYSLNRRSLQSCLNTAPPPTDECVGYIYPFNRVPKVANVNYDVVLRVTFTIPVSHSKKNVCFVETCFEASFICRDNGIWRSGSEDFWVKDSVLRLYSGSSIMVVWACIPFHREIEFLPLLWWLQHLPEPMTQSGNQTSLLHDYLVSSHRLQSHCGDDWEHQQRRVEDHVQGLALSGVEDSHMCKMYADARRKRRNGTIRHGVRDTSAWRHHCWSDIPQDSEGINGMVELLRCSSESGILCSFTDKGKKMGGQGLRSYNLPRRIEHVWHGKSCGVMSRLKSFMDDEALLPSETETDGLLSADSGTTGCKWGTAGKSGVFLLFEWRLFSVDGMGIFSFFFISRMWLGLMDITGLMMIIGWCLLLMRITSFNGWAWTLSIRRFLALVSPIAVIGHQVAPTTWEFVSTNWTLDDVAMNILILPHQLVSYIIRSWTHFAFPPTGIVYNQ